MYTRLFIKGLEVFANHGLFKEENKLGQKFVFNVVCSVNYQKAMFSDKIIDSISYADIAEVIYTTTTENTFNLLERLAGEIVKNIFDTFSEVIEIELDINKPGAPIKYHFSKCGVNVKVSREEFEAF